MARPVFTGMTAAAALPAALSAAVLVSAPYAGTTTSPLSQQTRLHHGAGHHPVPGHQGSVRR